MKWGSCGSGKAIICIHPGSMYRKEETRNDGKTRANCRLFITDDVSFARWPFLVYHWMSQGGARPLQPIAQTRMRQALQNRGRQTCGNLDKDRAGD